MGVGFGASVPREFVLYGLAPPRDFGYSWMIGLLVKVIEPLFFLAKGSQRHKLARNLYHAYFWDLVQLFIIELSFLSLSEGSLSVSDDRVNILTAYGLKLTY